MDKFQNWPWLSNKLKKTLNRPTYSILMISRSVYFCRIEMKLTLIWVFWNDLLWFTIIFSHDLAKNDIRCIICGINQWLIHVSSQNFNGKSCEQTQMWLIVYSYTVNLETESLYIAFRLYGQYLNLQRVKCWILRNIPPARIWS